MGDLVLLDDLGKSPGVGDVQAKELDLVLAAERDELKPTKVTVEVCRDDRCALVE
jgi:hypothetical protein